VIVVDDGSSDRTAEVAELAGAEIIKHPINLGKGAALRTGFEASGDTDIIVTIDTDGQHDPVEIPKLAAPIMAGEADMVNGSRYMNGSDRNTPAYRRVGQTVLDKATNLNSGLKITDTQSGFRAFAGSAVSAFKFRNNGFGIESEMLTDAANAGLRVKEVEIGVRYDVDCSTEHPVSHGVRVLVKVLYDMELNRCAGNGDRWYRGVYGVEFSEYILPWGEFDVRADAVDDNVFYGRDFYELYRDHTAFGVKVDQRIQNELRG